MDTGAVKRSKAPRLCNDESHVARVPQQPVALEGAVHVVVFKALHCRGDGRAAKPRAQVAFQKRGKSLELALAAPGRRHHHVGDGRLLIPQVARTQVSHNVVGGH